MKQSPLLEFRSDAFAIAPGEDDRTNPGIFGKALAEWLSRELRARGLSAGEVMPEDFGWCVPLQSKPHVLYIVCTSAEDQSGSWRVFSFADGGLIGRLFGKEDTREKDVARAYGAAKAALVARADVRDVSEESVVNKSQPPFAAWFLCLLIATVCSGLAYLAIVERAISISGKGGMTFYEGSSAVVFGFILLGLAIASLATLARASRFRNLIWFGFLVIWVLCLVAYVTFTL